MLLAFAVYRRIHDHRARLTFVGGQSAGLYWRALHQLADDLDIAGAVTFADTVSHEELLAYYRTSDVFVLLSEHEGFNVPVLEAMHFGVPVVAYASTAVPGHGRRRRACCSPTRTRSSWRPRSSAYARTSRCAGCSWPRAASASSTSPSRAPGPQVLETLTTLMKETA